MKKIVFDSGPIISLTTNNLLWLLPRLKRDHKVSFLLPQGVKKELVDKPLATKKFKYEALQVQRLIDDGVLEIIDNRQVADKAKSFQDLANSIFYAKRQNMRVIQYGEMAAFATAKILDADAVVVDERISRSLIECPRDMTKLIGRRLHTKVNLNEKNLAEFTKVTKGIKIIRSAELVTIAYEKGILDSFLVNVPDPKGTLIESILWGVKLQGCAISEEEINQIRQIEKQRRK